MATSNRFGNLNPGENEVELIDVASLILVGISMPMIFRVTAFSIDVFGGYSMTEPIWVIITNLLNDQT